MNDPNDSREISQGPLASTGTSEPAPCAEQMAEPGGPQVADVTPLAACEATGSQEREPVPAGPAVESALTRLEDASLGLRTLIEGLGKRLGAVEVAVGDLGKQIALVPPQVRMLAGKVEGVATSISEPRCRALLLDLLMLHDLARQMAGQVPSTSGGNDAEYRRHSEVLVRQIRQVLEANGLSEIGTDGPFDPSVHRAVHSVPCSDPAASGRVLQVLRPGFRTERAVLRYADVAVGSYVPPAPETGGAAELTAVAPASESSP